MKIYPLLFLLLALTVSACSEQSTSEVSKALDTNVVQKVIEAEKPRLVTYTEKREVCDHYTEERIALFGDLHVHSAYSFDAAANSLETYPEDANNFAKGLEIPFFPVDENGKPTGKIKLERPLDFVSVTDHGEFLGERALCRTPGSPKYDIKFCKNYRASERQGMLMIGTIITLEEPKRFPELCGEDGELCREWSKGPWQEMIAAAENADDKSSACAFTSLVGYEYTGTPGLSNIHRNVIFRNANVPELPVSYVEAPTDKLLWKTMNPLCNEENNCDYMTIPHNSNLANGRMFSLIQGGTHDEEHHGDGHAHPNDEEQRQHAHARQQHEPVVEIFQHKGNSECMNGISSIFGEPDEHCEFESVRKFGKIDHTANLQVVDGELTIEYRDIDTDQCDDNTGLGGMEGAGCVHRTDFVRSHLLEGLKDEQRLGVNSAKIGIIASTDTHTSTPGAVAEDNWQGHVSLEATPEERLEPGLLTSGIEGNPGGLAGVWAVENSRDAIFDALQRREVFGTSGPRIKPRLFAGWDFADGICESDTKWQQAYASGVPMGQDVNQSDENKSLQLLAYAEADSIQGATPLEKLQIIKGWVNEEGEAHYKVIDVAESPQGASNLCTVFSDPDFDASRSAYYYLRALEKPSPRWSTYDCQRIPEDQRPEVCGEESTVPKIIQEMAWSSPIWYKPSN